MKPLIYFFLTAMICAACDSHSRGHTPQPQVKVPFTHLNYKPRKFAGCTELTQYRSEKQKEWQKEIQKYNAWAASEASGSGTNSSGGSSGGATGVGAPVSSPVNMAASPQVQVNFDFQESNVIEPDQVALSGDWLFTARQHSIEMTSVNTLSKIDSLAVADMQNIKLFVFTRNAKVWLYAIGQDSNWSGTTLKTFLVSNSGLSQQSSQIFEGQNIGARIVGDDFYLVLNDYGTHVASDDAGCADVYQPVLPDYQLGMNKLVHINISTGPTSLKTTGFLGNAEDIYMTDENLYLLHNHLEWFSWDQRFQDSPYYAQYTLIQKISLNSGQPQHESVGFVSGQFKDRWSLKELKNSQQLAVAVTKSDLNTWNPSSDVNDLHILQTDLQTGELKAIATYANFAKSESIKSVRYIDDFAYVVTFKKTDPLFIFDLNDPTKIKHVAELKADGFSTALYPLANDSLLGVGFAVDDQGDFAWAQGIQLSLIGLQDKTSPLLITQKTFGGRGSISDATHDHHALFSSSDAKIIGLPIVSVETYYPQSFMPPTPPPPTPQPTVQVESGFYLFDSTNLEEVESFSHKNLMPPKCLEALNSTYGWWNFENESLDVQRVFETADYYFAISRFGITRTAKLPTGTPAKALSFDQTVEAAEEQCEETVYLGL